MFFLSLSRCAGTNIWVGVGEVISLTVKASKYYAVEQGIYCRVIPVQGTQKILTALDASILTGLIFFH
jgi:hypothetical protein